MSFLWFPLDLTFRSGLLAFSTLVSFRGSELGVRRRIMSCFVLVMILIKFPFPGCMYETQGPRGRVSTVCKLKCLECVAVLWGSAVLHLSVNSLVGLKQL